MESIIDHECQICKKIKYRFYKLIPCHHSFCIQCIGEFTLPLQCPTCKSEITGALKDRKRNHLTETACRCILQDIKITNIPIHKKNKQETLEREAKEEEKRSIINAEFRLCQLSMIFLFGSILSIIIGVVLNAITESRYKERDCTPYFIEIIPSDCDKPISCFDILWNVTINKKDGIIREEGFYPIESAQEESKKYPIYIEQKCFVYSPDITIKWTIPRDQLIYSIIISCIFIVPFISLVVLFLLFYFDKKKILSYQQVA